MTKYTSQKIKRLCNRSYERCAILNYAIEKEAYLEKVCKKVWEAYNPKNEMFLFAKYVNPNDKNDTTIVTLGYYSHLGGTKYTTV